MTSGRTFFLMHAQARQAAWQAIAQAPDGYMVTISPPKRSNAQNRAMWPILEAFSQQLQWSVNGERVQMTAEEWKDVLTAGFRQETTRIAAGWGGGVVMLGSRTSQMDKPEFGEFLEFLHAAAVERGVEVYPIDYQEPDLCRA